MVVAEHDRRAWACRALGQTNVHSQGHGKADWQTPCVIPIEDPADERLDVFRALHARESTELVWAEGPTVVERLIASPCPVRGVLMTPAARRRFEPMVAALDAPVYVAEQEVVTATVGFVLNIGILAVGERPALKPLADVLVDARLVVVLENINDAVNLGAIARSARALGVDALVLDPTCADPYYRRSVRVSMGEMLHIPIARVDLGSGLHEMVAGGFDVWALTPRGDATPIGQAVRDGVPERLALVLGAEGPGLSDLVLAHHRNVCIPVRDDVDSLNVGHAAAAALAVVQAFS